ncbi:MAG: hypothetical protein KKA19_07295 [Candidatus Margulisbacteria bacterium]|nr:hypothetical protein [Candidatus Margulisiibacteriota bacterium]
MGEEQILEKVSRKFIHDIRTPISVLNMLKSLFESGNVSKDDLNIMQEELAKMDILVNKYAEEVKKYYQGSPTA